MPIRHMLISAVLLGLFAVAGTGLVAVTFDQTKAQIAENERQALLDYLNSMLPAGSYDNDIYNDTIQIAASELGSAAPLTAYRARLAGQPVAAVLTVIAAEGYGGDIRLLVAIRYDGSVAGVRVLSHKETPGLGDKIEPERSDWLMRFVDRSLSDPSAEKWKVRKDGGVFDQFTGATITPRAVVKAVYHALRYFEAHREALFAPRREEQR